MPKVLYLEKDEFLRDMVELCFENHPIEVHTRDKLSEYLFLIEDLKIDLLLLDVRLYRMEWENLRELSQGASSLVLPSIELWAVGTEKELGWLDDRGIKVTHRLVKPLSPTFLMQKLTQHFGGTSHLTN